MTWCSRRCRVGPRATTISPRSPAAERIDALEGIDTVTFGFRLVDAAVSYIGDAVVIDGPSSHTVLTGVERFVFTDGTVESNDGNVLVDDLFYYSRNHDVWNAHIDADAHFRTDGGREGRDPNAFFDTSIYLAANPDVAASGVDPLAHFDQGGWREGRIPSTTFDPRGYLAANPDVMAAGVDPLWHYPAVRLPGRARAVRADRAARRQWLRLRPLPAAQSRRRGIGRRTRSRTS